MNRRIIIFVCEHGAAKSVIAAAHFNRLAIEANSDIRAIARGTNPDPELSPKTVSGLKADGLNPEDSAPQKLSPKDLEIAHRMIAFCELPAEYQGRVDVETWDGVPPVSEDYVLARDEIIRRLSQLFK